MDVPFLGVHRAATTHVSTRTPSLYWEQHGRLGPAVVFLHGLLGSTHYWDGAVALLKQARLRLYVPDLLGFGRSPKPELAYTVTDHLQALDNWLQVTGLEREPLLVVGHSLGAILAVEWAISHPQMQSLLLTSLPVFRDPVAARARLSRLSFLNWLTLAPPPLDRMLCRTICTQEALWQFTAPMLVRDLPLAVTLDGRRHTPDSLYGTLEHCVFRFVARGALGRVADRHLLCLHGEADDTALLGDLAAMAEEIPNLNLVSVPQVDHHLPIRRPDLVANMVQSLLGQVM